MAQGLLVGLRSRRGKRATWPRSSQGTFQEQSGDIGDSDGNLKSLLIHDIEWKEQDGRYTC